MLINSQTLLFVAFELCLFGLLCTLLAYLFKNILLPTLYGEIARKKNEHDNLVSEKELTQATKASVAHQIITQKKTLNELDKKLKAAYEQRLKRRRMQEEQQACLKERIEKKRSIQKRNLHLENLKEEVIPSAIREAHDEMERDYRTNKGREVLMELIDELEKQSKKNQRSLRGSHAH